MIVLILSDIHANREAFEAVLAHAGAFDRLWFLGDAVGYGPDPNACVERLLELAPEVWLAGNHDHAALGKLDLSTFNPEARRAAEWTGDQLSAAALPDGAFRWPYVLDEALPLADSRWLINPGGVGQPRDGDPRASYARLDLERRQLTFHRVAYAIPTVQRKILAAGLPPRLAARLDYGW